MPRPWAKDSPEIENIITTQDDLCKADLFADYILDIHHELVLNDADPLVKMAVIHHQG